MTEQEKYDNIRRETVRYLAIASEHYNIKFKLHAVLFNIKEDAGLAGQARYTGSSLSRLTYTVRYNKTFIKNEYARFIARTVPHEVAHVVAIQLVTNRVLSRKQLQREGSHGRTWKQIMHLFGAEAERCHSYDITHARPFMYSCACNDGERLHALSKILHNRIVKGRGGRFCSTCRKHLTYHSTKNV